MMTIKARNVNDAYNSGLWHMKTEAMIEETRNGQALVSPAPVMTVYNHPFERVLFDSKRNANPFFHLAECVWMIAGSNEAKWISQFNKQMWSYSDDMETFHGAYGYRWRTHFDFDQLADIINMLRRNSGTRQAVLTMWSPKDDLDVVVKDIPCNTHIYFRVKSAGSLDMTVMCRSNDMVWGAYGANAVHFSFLHEFVARATGYIQGYLYQLSNNFHIYEKHWPLMDGPNWDGNPYVQGSIKVIPIMQDGSMEWQQFREDCVSMIGGHQIYRSPFLSGIVQPMLDAYITKDVGPLAEMPDCDWKLAGQQWFARREHASQ